MRKFLIKVSGEQYEVEVEEIKNENTVLVSAKAPVLTPAAPKAVLAPAPTSSHKSVSKIDSPMPGNILKINVKVGDTVAKGQTVFVLEAMKMENEIAAPAAGKVAGIHAKTGETVDAGQTIIILE